MVFFCRIFVEFVRLALMHIRMTTHVFLVFIWLHGFVFGYQQEADHFYQKAMKLYKEGDLTEAIGLFDHAVKSDPDIFTLYINNRLLDELLARENIQITEMLLKICQTYAHAATNGSDKKQLTSQVHPLAFYYMGRIYWEIENFPECKKMLETCLELYRKDDLFFPGAEVLLSLVQKKLKA